MPEAGTVHAGDRRRPSSSPPRTLQGAGPPHPPSRGCSAPATAPSGAVGCGPQSQNLQAPTGGAQPAGGPCRGDLPRPTQQPPREHHTDEHHQQRRVQRVAAPPPPTAAARLVCCPATAAPSTTLPALRRRSLIPVPADSARRPAPCTWSRSRSWFATTPHTATARSPTIWRLRRTGRLGVGPQLAQAQHRCIHDPRDAARDHRYAHCRTGAGQRGCG